VGEVLELLAILTGSKNIQTRRPDYRSGVFIKMIVSPTRNQNFFIKNHGLVSCHSAWHFLLLCGLGIYNEGSSRSINVMCKF
jgi:hypothetical protein